ncbi:MAG: hypothetical protein GF309_11045 [Candidatus Lokiarchaeota archaeon]|jgi:hypothetical protein|nr:hypothetical protein [Candidatus Lokiarchaeota archaeon]
MSASEDGWALVIDAFEDWIDYESSEFAPWTTYFSIKELRTLTHSERLGWMHTMRDEIIPGRIDSARQARIALEDFMAQLSEEGSLKIVQSMIDLSIRLEESMLQMSDVFTHMMEDYEEEGLDAVQLHLEKLAEIEEDIRHHMSLYSEGFSKLRERGREIPEEMR